MPVRSSVRSGGLTGSLRAAASDCWMRRRCACVLRREREGPHTRERFFARALRRPFSAALRLHTPPGRLLARVGFSSEKRNSIRLAVLRGSITAFVPQATHTHKPPQPASHLFGVSLHALVGLRGAGGKGEPAGLCQVGCSWVGGMSVYSYPHCCGWWWRWGGAHSTRDRRTGQEGSSTGGEGRPENVFCVWSS